MRLLISSWPRRPTRLRQRLPDIRTNPNFWRLRTIIERRIVASRTWNLSTSLSIPLVPGTVSFVLIKNAYNNSTCHCICSDFIFWHRFFVRKINIIRPSARDLLFIIHITSRYHGHTWRVFRKILIHGSFIFICSGWVLYIIKLRPGNYCFTPKPFLSLVPKPHLGPLAESGLPPYL